MKKFLLATVVALSTTVQADTHSFDISLLDELEPNYTIDRNVLLTAYGVIDYYQNNCAGLTDYGKKLTMQSLYKSDLHLLEATELMNTKAFKKGFVVASSSRCNDLRDEMFKIGSRRVFR